MLTEQGLDQRLSEADSGANLAVKKSVFNKLVSDSRRASHRSKRIRFASLTGALALIVTGGVVAGPAVADVVRDFIAQANWFPPAGGEILPSSEWVDTSAPDLREYVDSIYETFLPLPPGQSRASIVEATATLHAANPALTQEVSLRRTMEDQVYMGWITEWIAANDAGDSQRMAAAATVLQQAPT